MRTELQRMLMCLTCTSFPNAHVRSSLWIRKLVQCPIYLPDYKYRVQVINTLNKFSLKPLIPGGKTFKIIIDTNLARKNVVLTRLNNTLSSHRRDARLRTGFAKYFQWASCFSLLRSCRGTGIYKIKLKDTNTRRNPNVYTVN